MLTGSQTTGVHETGTTHPTKVTNVGTLQRYPHPGGKTSCPAYGKSCRGCGKQNDFEAVCRSKNTKKKNSPRNRTRDVQHLVDQNSSSEESDDVGYTFSVNSTGKEQLQPMFKVIIHNTPLTIMADSGASVNVFDEKDYRALSEPPKLQQTKVKIHPYKSNESLTVLVKLIYYCFKVQVNMHSGQNLCSPRIWWFIA